VAFFIVPPYICCY